MSRAKPTPLNVLKQTIPKGAKLLLAVSGGVDSVCLLHACVSLKRLLKLHLEVAHVDHKLRKSSAKDAKFVRALAQKYNLPFHLKVASNGPGKANLEAWGRELRYDYFCKLSQERKLDWIVTAHNANDVAETFLMRIFSNKEPRSILKVDMQRKLLRPFLQVTRDKLESYLAEHKLEFVQDQTNFDTSYLRNRVRYTILPFLEKEFGVGLVETLSQRARQIAQDIETLLDGVAASIGKLESVEMGSREWLGMLKAELEKLPEGLRWRLVVQLLKNKLGFNLGERKAREALGVIMGKRKAVQLPTGLVLSLINGRRCSFSTNALVTEK